MKLSTSRFLLCIAVVALSALQACKTKKLAQDPPHVYHNTLPDPPVVEKTRGEQPPAQETQPQQTEQAPAPAKPDYNFRNIQFEFNSAILKTDSYPILDHIAAEMKKDNSAQFTLNGNSSTEGTPQYNMTLSIERANAVKTYLINSGIADNRLTVKGFGETRPIANNDTEEGKALNRRVEVKVNP